MGEFWHWTGVHGAELRQGVTVPGVCFLLLPPTLPASAGSSRGGQFCLWRVWLKEETVQKSRPGTLGNSASFPWLLPPTPPRALGTLRSPCAQKHTAGTERLRGQGWCSACDLGLVLSKHCSIIPFGKPCEQKSYLASATLSGHTSPI